MQDKILDFLKRKDGYVSGEEISAYLEISRQALWKHIQALKDSGYDIVAVPHLGYKIISSPDRLFPTEIKYGLATKSFGKDIHYFDTLSSTMDTAMQLGIKGAAEGTLILAETQQKGRGRMGRSWNSPKYKGIYMSLILKPQIPPNQAPMLTLLSAVGVCEAIGKVTGLEAKIKWPNDIFIHGRKSGGILTELDAETDAIRFVIIGIGLNVNNDRKSLISGATSLKEETKAPVNRIALLQEALRRIEYNYLLFKKEGAAPIADKWRSYNLTLGKRIKICLYKDHMEGEAVDIDADGALIVRKDSGIFQKITAGDIIHCR
jgi:BirA family biotin operon repressor/biotin-[acetyl-CoA-carboxylase] ligase